MYRNLLIVSLLISSVSAGSKTLEYKETPIQVHSANGKTEQIIVKREIPEACKKVSISNEMFWTGSYANPQVPKECVSSYVHSVGKLLPMKLHEFIDTFGELETLKFMKEMQSDDSKLLIDGRKEEWYTYRTIPGAINMPFHHFKEREHFEFEFEEHLKTLGVKVNKDESLDFSKAKTITIFCNGPWCTQSGAMIKALLDIGYPPYKINWYRGGMQEWLAAGMTSTRK